MSVWDLSVWIVLVDCVVADNTRGVASRVIRDYTVNSNNPDRQIPH